jgi:raffinose/stachyose/melibiose transport system permease protein
MAIITIPSLSTLVMSFTEWNGIGEPNWIGFQNFIDIFTIDRVVRTAIANNLRWMTIFLTVPIFMGFTVAVLISRVKRFQMLFRTAMFIPFVLSAAVVGAIWTAYFNPFYGINVLFESLGWTNLANILWIGDPSIALYSIAFVDNWRWWGFVMIIFLGAMQQVDPSLYESARVDGGSGFQEVIYITLPSIKRTISFMLIMTVMWSFLTFDYVWVMTQGGPANSTEILATWIYRNAFIRFNAGYANALVVIQSAICVGFYFIQRYITKKGRLEEE